MTAERRTTAALAAAVLLGAGVTWAVSDLSAEPAPAVAAVQTLPEEPFWSYPLCAVEDASSGPLPCLWPADKVGNGLGNTFYVEPGPNGTRCFHYVNRSMDRKRGGCE